ncbi:hypothetical protein [Desertifilum tharense]|uniref:hypothetical protein n=1 Tax=Desertifilum tharense TaxID=1185873 RepID=UPI003F820F41
MPNSAIKGFTEDDPVELLPDWTILHLDLLEEALEAVKPSLLIIDSVRTAIAYPLGLDENNTGIGAYLKTSRGASDPLRCLRRLPSPRQQE